VLAGMANLRCVDFDCAPLRSYAIGRNPQKILPRTYESLS
jgi:hypothetical protein